MKGHNTERFLFLTLISIALLSSYSYAGYWFQFGARGGQSSAFNNGAKVDIQTITPQNVSLGSYGYWVGETLSNGAFVQIGYVIENQTGNYPSDCSVSGCSGSQFLKAGHAEWFYEYFPAGQSSSFLGKLGPDDSAGANGTTNTYSFYSVGDTWYFKMNDQLLGSVALGASDSGPSSPVAFGEAANVSLNNQQMPKIIFSNLSAYTNGAFHLVRTGYSYIGYGVGSETTLKNPYGVEELGNRINYFAVGSGLKQPSDNSVLWSLGYTLNVVSEYANLSSSVPYKAYSTINIVAPTELYFGPSARALFKSWSGSGIQSYTGTSNSIRVSMYSNITEVANWQTEYFLNVTSDYGQTDGSGWHTRNSTVVYSLNTTNIYVNQSFRRHFVSWSTNALLQNVSFKLSYPLNVHAAWSSQYLVNITSPYNETFGSGWHDIGNTILVGANRSTIAISPTERIEFKNWSNGATENPYAFNVTAPISLRANFAKQYLVNIIPLDANGNVLKNVSLMIDGNVTTNSTFLFANEEHKINAIIYKNSSITSNYSINPTSSQTLPLNFSIADVTIRSIDILGLPINASMEIHFANGTSLSMYTGDNGLVTFSDVPYGRVNGTLTYRIFSSHFSSSMQDVVTVFFISFQTAALAAILILLAAAYIFIRRYVEHRHKLHIKGLGEV